jgi:REP element-mobilizing transposase RayT
VESKTGIYHVMMQGINHQNIFEEDEDFLAFLQFIKDYKKKSEFKLYAYCLMNNHAHLLIKASKTKLSKIFKSVGARYAYWYNLKYRRTGHLFQDRFKSEPVEDEQYFLSVLRYIHQNPMKSCLSDSIDGYKWSSFNEYMKKRSFVNTRYALKMIGADDFLNYNTTECNGVFLQNEKKSPRLNDADLKDLIKSLLGPVSFESLQKLDKPTRNQYLKKLKESGASIRQISRITGINRGIVEKS